ncbi:MAG: Txe/YoeB family addiction module toxin [Chitinispirillales bacterium]|jgi:Txe/YoeB family toxin of toxin-antitoxin system|nr:Txe/YoeB family addiction module toxin [Chitinispirillales bacterium]
MYNVKFTKQAAKDAKKIGMAGLKSKVEALIDIIKNNPYQNPPPYEKLSGRSSMYSRRINVHHRLVYRIFENNTLRIIRMWTHYE